MHKKWCIHGEVCGVTKTKRKKGATVIVWFFPLEKRRLKTYLYQSKKKKRTIDGLKIKFYFSISLGNGKILVSVAFFQFFSAFMPEIDFQFNVSLEAKSRSCAIPLSKFEKIYFQSGSQFDPYNQKW